MFYFEPVFFKSKLMSTILKTKRHEVIWHSVQFILKNVYLNRHLSSETIIKNILVKPSHLRNLFDIRYLLNAFCSNAFFTKMTEEGSTDLTYQCMKELNVSA